MLNELPTIGENHLLQRKHLTDRHSFLLEKVMKENSHKEKYWILGWPKIKRKNGQTRITPMMMAMDKQPEITKNSYLYEVDNKAGTKVLLWVMHPNDQLRLPTLGKSIRVAGESGV